MKETMADSRQKDVMTKGLMTILIDIHTVKHSSHLQYALELPSSVCPVTLLGGLRLIPCGDQSRR